MVSSTRRTLELGIPQFLVALIATWLAQPASAFLVGDEVTGCLRATSATCDENNQLVFPPPPPPIPRPTAVVVGGPDTPEFEDINANSYSRADFDETTLRLTWGVTAGVTGFGGSTWEFGDLDFPFDIGGLEEIGTNLPPGANAVFADDAIIVNIPNLILEAGETAFLELRILAPVPSYSAPSLVVLVVLLLGTALFVMWRRAASLRQVRSPVSSASRAPRSR